MKLTKSTTLQFRWALDCIQQPLPLFNQTRPTWPAWTRTRHAPAVERNSLVAVVSGVEPVNGAAPERRTEYPPRWGRVSRWVRGRAGSWCVRRDLNCRQERLFRVPTRHKTMQRKERTLADSPVNSEACNELLRYR